MCPMKVLVNGIKRTEKMQTSRSIILDKINSIPIDPIELPDLQLLEELETNLVEKFCNTLTTIGGTIIEIDEISEIENYILTHFPTQRVSMNLPNSAKSWIEDEPHSLQNVDFLVIEGQFGVAENGAIWITEEQMGQRVAPFITQHLGIVLSKKNMVNTMHEAYKIVNRTAYSYGTFLAGPSKTADIEQSLVLGAHGARTLIVFLFN